MMAIFIYCLRDPRDQTIRYIGKSTRPERRLKAHLKDKMINVQKEEWIGELQELGLRPELAILQEVTEGHDWREAEKDWIRRGLAKGWPLVNGGSGVKSDSDTDCLLPFIRPDLIDVFQSLSHEERMEICTEAAKVGLPYLLLILRQWRTGPADIELKDSGYFAAAEVANQLIRQCLCNPIFTNG